MDLKEHSRELVAQMERDLGTRLQWPLSIITTPTTRTSTF
jgi:hypothetical protein